jgi:hypothetical protein
MIAPDTCQQPALGAECGDDIDALVLQESAWVPVCSTHAIHMLDGYTQTDVESFDEEDTIEVGDQL